MEKHFSFRFEPGGKDDNVFFRETLDQLKKGGSEKFSYR